MLYNYNINAIKALLKQIYSNNKQETEINRRILWYIFASKSKVINITDSTILKDIKARL